MIDSQLDERSAELPLLGKLQRHFIELRNTSHLLRKQRLIYAKTRAVAQNKWKADRGSD
jgi:hypothetical protein